jgi:hypothetical protein
MLSQYRKAYLMLGNTVVGHGYGAMRWAMVASLAATCKPDRIGSGASTTDLLS